MQTNIRKIALLYLSFLLINEFRGETSTAGHMDSYCLVYGIGKAKSLLPHLVVGGILVSIRTREGLIIRKGGLSYQELRELVEKLEVLC